MTARHDQPHRRYTAAVLFFVVGTFSASAGAQSDIPTQRGREAVKKGLRFLLATQEPDGGWRSFDQSHPAISALVLKALAEDPGIGPDHPAVKRGFNFLLGFRQDDGGIYNPQDAMPNYHTSVVLMALSSSGDPEHVEIARRAQRFLEKIQWDEPEGHERGDAWYGGQGYGKHERPDLSNTQMMMEALYQSGLSSDSDAYHKAVVFISRCQMLESTNDQPFAKGATGGGFIYTPAGAKGGESKAGVESVDDRPMLRSYGTMTYAGFKSLLYAKLDHEDARVKKAFSWIQSHYTLDQNPNMPTAQAQEGLYYFYHTFARALRAWGEPTIVDHEGKKHNWRHELFLKLASLQNPDGSWSNDADRWYEGNPYLVTAYSIRALQSALEK